MDKLIDHIIWMSELSEEQLGDLRRATASDADLARLVALWRQFRSVAQRNLEDEVGDSRLFRLFVLHRAGHRDILTLEELEMMEELADRYGPLLEHSSALAHVAEDIRESADVFSKMWDAELNEDAGRDRSAVRRAAGESISGARLRQRPTARAGERPAITGRARPGARRSRTRSTTARWVIRAAIILTVMAFAFVLTQVVQRDTGTTTIRTAADEVRIVELASGSRVRLLESSELTYVEPTTSSSLLRQASIVGRAYFEITPEERGFIVRTPNARITVLGTTFGVEAFERLTEVVLAEGSLTLASEADIKAYVALEPGQMSRVVTGSRPIEPLPVELSERLAWTGLFVFHSTPLRRIADQLSAHFQVPIVVEETLEEEQITGTFEQSQPLQDILRVIAEAVGATSSARQSGDLVIERR